MCDGASVYLTGNGDDLRRLSRNGELAFVFHEADNAMASSD